MLLALILLSCSLMLAWNISSTFLLLMMAYFTVSLAYSAFLKEIVVVDLCCISAGFLLRLQAGGVAFDVAISVWIVLSVFLLSIFLSAGKRLSEKQRLGDDAHSHRKALAAYSSDLLNWIMYVTGGSVLITYAMYAISRHSTLLIYSVPLCCFGLLRYVHRLRSGMGGDPTESLTRDMPLLITGFLWAVMVGWGIYGA